MSFLKNVHEEATDASDIMAGLADFPKPVSAPKKPVQQLPAAGAGAGAGAGGSQNYTPFGSGFTFSGDSKQLQYQPATVGSGFGVGAGAGAGSAAAAAAPVGSFGGFGFTAENDPVFDLPETKTGEEEEEGLDYSVQITEPPGTAASVVPPGLAGLVSNFPPGAARPKSQARPKSAHLAYPKPAWSKRGSVAAAAAAAKAAAKADTERLPDFKAGSKGDLLVKFAQLLLAIAPSRDIGDVLELSKLQLASSSIEDAGEFNKNWRGYFVPLWAGRVAAAIDYTKNQRSRIPESASLLDFLQPALGPYNLGRVVRSTMFRDSGTWRRKTDYREAALDEDKALDYFESRLGTH